MKQWIAKEQVMELSPAAQQRLEAWLRESIEYDDDPVRVYIPQEDSVLNGEEDAKTSGVFSGHWDEEFEFNMPFDEEYMEPGCTCKLLSHRGTILPLLDIGQMMEIISENDLLISVQVSDGTCDYLWLVVRGLMESDIVVR